MADKPSRKSGGNQPISRHPLFPAIVALWFGALFGLAGIAIDPALIEHVVLAARIDSLIPMAAPPLGATARVLMALAMTGLGCVAGLLIARRIARLEPETHVRRRDAATLAADDTPMLAARHGADEEAILPHLPAREADQAEARLPLAAREASILDVSDFELDSFDAVEDLAPEAPAPVEERDPAGGSLFDAYSREITRRAAAGEEEESAPGYPLCATTNDNAALPERAETNGAHRIAAAELDSLSQVELLERLALAIARRRSEAVYTAAAVDVPEVPEALAPAAPEPEAEHPVLSEADREPQADDPEHNSASFEPARPALPRLGALPIETSREDRAETEPEAPQPASEPPRVPAALRPVGHHFPGPDEEDEDEPLPGYIPPRHIVFSPDVLTEHPLEPVDTAFDHDDAESEEEEGEVLEEGYSSLLDLSRPAGARQPLIRVDETEDEDAARPVAIFPGEEAAPASFQARRPFDAPGENDAEETEKALRAALATLKRMSGAA